MGKLFFLIATLACLGLWANPDASRLQWETNYSEALQQAKASSKPLVLLFTGSDWCPLCHKIEKEVLNTVEFADVAGNKFVFVMLDFPMYKAADPKIADQNKQLQSRFDVKLFPTLVIIDPNEQLIGTTGYKPGGPKAFANVLIDMVKNYNQYHQKLSEANKSSTSSAELKKLYLKACELGRGEEACRLVSLGLDSDERIFFLLEKYRLLATEGQIHDPLAQGIKKEIKLLDPQNERGTAYEVAIIEFDAYSEALSEEKSTAELAIAPLVTYIQNFGKKDPERVWKLQMVISQVFLDKNKLAQALEYARASYETAPETVKSEIAIAVKNIQLEIKN